MMLFIATFLCILKNCSIKKNNKRNQIIAISIFYILANYINKLFWKLLKKIC